MQEYLWKELLSLPFLDAGIGIQQYFLHFRYSVLMNLFSLRLCPMACMGYLNLKSCKVV